MKQVFSNLGYGFLAKAVDKVDTVLEVSQTSGIPTLNENEYFLATLFERAGNYGNNLEIVKVTHVSGNLWTVERGVENTDPLVHRQNASVELRLTAGGLKKAIEDGQKVVSFAGRTGKVEPKKDDYSSDQIKETDEKQFVSKEDKTKWNDGASKKDVLLKTALNAPEGVAGLDENGKLSEEVYADKLTGLQAPIALFWVDTPVGRVIRWVNTNIFYEKVLLYSANVESLENIFNNLPVEISENKNWYIEQNEENKKDVYVVCVVNKDLQEYSDLITEIPTKTEENSGNDVNENFKILVNESGKILAIENGIFLSSVI